MPASVAPLPALGFSGATAPATGLPWSETRFVADWRRMLFVHFALPPRALASCTPFELETHAGRAFVSLVFFTLERMRPPGTGALGRLLLRPISDHPFLNLRTYVRAGDATGIQFLAEWIPNPLSLRLGPATYGLPYRLGRFSHQPAGAGGIGHLHVRGCAEDATLALAYPDNPQQRPAPCQRGSVDEFLLERYTAFTCRRRVKRRFTVAHEPWQVRPVDWMRLDLDLITRAFPWFKHAEFHSAHLSPGVANVRMGRPRRVE